MARVTVEDCIQNVPNRFELVIMAAQRAKQISSGTPLTVDRDNDKDAVVSLREIGDRTIDLETLKEELIQSHCKKQTLERIERAAMKFQQQGKEGLEDQIAEAFVDAGKGIKAPGEDDDADEAEEAEEGTAAGGLSFEGDNVDVED